MLINLTDVFTVENKELNETVSIGFDKIMFCDTEYSVTLKQPVKLVLTYVEKGKAKLQGTGEAVITLNCDRCLKEVDVLIPVDFSYQIYAPERVLSEDDKEEQFFVNGYQLDTDLLLNNEVLILWPMKVLCHESCKGICPVCGKNRNNGDCGCDDFVPDPRMAKIKDIFNANKEV